MLKLTNPILLKSGRPWNPQHSFSRGYADCGDSGNKKGIVLGVYDGCNPGEFKLTSAASKFNEDTHGKLSELLRGAELGPGRAQVFSNIHNEYHSVAVAGLGPETAGMNSMEYLDECKENVRVAAGVGAQALQDRGITSIFLESFTNAESSAEGAVLGVWRYQELRTGDRRLPNAKVELFEGADREGWQRGQLKADAQNLARYLEEIPANMLTPSKFAAKTIDALCPCGIQVEVRDKIWLERNNMSTLLALGRCSCESPLFLELGYCTAGLTDKPVVIIGKGVTFDTGGVMLKHAEGMDTYRAEMAGAAVIVASVLAAANLNLPINLQAYLPLSENLLGGMSMKPGDVLKGLAGQTIRLEDTDNEGRVLAVDALTYSALVKPCLALHIGTISEGTKRALGSAATAVWTRSNVLWYEMMRAGAETGDRVWRMPMWKEFLANCSDDISVDMSNAGHGDAADPCVAAAFLEAFAPKCDFVHLDIMGTGKVSTGIGAPYLRKGLMTGRPVRTVVQFLYQMACPHEKGDECGP